MGIRCAGDWDYNEKAGVVGVDRFAAGLNFSYVLPGRLAGLANPAAGDARGNVEFLYEQGIRAIVSLTERSLNRDILDEFGIEYRHLPVPDFQPPSLEQIDAFMAFYRRMADAGRAVAVHCTAGLGRTGTMLGCALVGDGMSARKAIETVRRIRPHSIETPQQEQAVRNYERLLATRQSRTPGLNSEDFSGTNIL